MTHTHISAPTRYIEANGVQFAYRRFGPESVVPLVFLQHFRGGMDHWDPTITDGFAKDRPVILFDNAGVGNSSGETPSTIEAMADHLADFVNALGLKQLDVLGFSIGGHAALRFGLGVGAEAVLTLSGQTSYSALGSGAGGDIDPSVKGSPQARFPLDFWDLRPLYDAAARTPPS